MRNGRAALRGKSGASMLFVLAAMLLLMAIGVSAIAAAGASWGASLTKRAENQLDLYVNSMELTLREVLREPETKKLADAETLTGQIFNKVYGQIGNVDGVYTYPVDKDKISFKMELEIDDDTADLFPDGLYESILIDGYLGVQFANAKPQVMGENEDGDEIEISPYVPETMKILGGEVTIEVTATLRGLSVKSATTYRLTGVSIINGNIIGPVEWNFHYHQRMDT